MRTTVTIDPDTEALLRDEVARTGQSFKQVLNGAIKKSLSKPTSKLTVTPLFRSPFPAELASTNFNHLSDDWDDEDTLREMSK